LLETVAAEIGLELPIPPRGVATLVGNVFLGAETEMLAGVSEDDAPHLAALESIGDLIERVESGRVPRPNGC
jgi:hypothetical protein